MKKKIVMMMILVLVLQISAFAQPPKPKFKPTSQTTQSINATEVKQPIGTATLLMLGLGAATVGYKIRKNRKEE